MKKNLATIKSKRTSGPSTSKNKKGRASVSSTKSAEKQISTSSASEVKKDRDSVSSTINDVLNVHADLQETGATALFTDHVGRLESSTSLFSPPDGDVHESESVLSVTDTDFTGSELIKDEKDLIETPKEHKYADDIIKAMKPYMLFMRPLLRFPLHLIKNPDGSYLFQYNRKSIVARGYVTTSWIIAIVGILISINTIGSVVDFPGIQNFRDPDRLNTVSGNLRYEERFIFRRNIITVLVVILNLIHASVTNYNLFSKRNFAAHYLTFWTEAVEVFEIDVSYELKVYVRKIVGFYGIFLFLFILSALLRFAPASTGGPAIFTMLTLRCFYPAIHTVEYFWIFRGFGGVLFIYTMICSKFFMIFFLIICRLLRNGFLVWNHRLDRILHRGEVDDSMSDKLKNRTSFDQLFKDHIMLVDLLEGGDTLFASIVESYYGTQLISIIFEVYYFYKSLTSVQDFQGVRRLDAIILGLYVAHSLAFLFAVSIAASNVGEEAAEGLEILRRKNLMGRKADDELYFTLSLYNSLTGPIQTALTGGNYFVLDKALLAGILGSIFSYFIILSQFSPLLLLTKDTEKIVETYQNDGLIDHVENTINYFGLKVTSN